MKAIWVRIWDKTDCQGKIVIDTECQVVVKDGTRCAKMSDGLILCPKCWKEYQKAWNKSPVHKKNRLEIDERAV